MEKKNLGDHRSTLRRQIPRGQKKARRMASVGRMQSTKSKSGETGTEDRKEDKSHPHESQPSVAAVGPWWREVLHH